MLRTCVLCCAVAGSLGLAAGCNLRTQDNPATQRDQAITTYKVQLGDLDKKIDELKAKIEKATAEEKPKLEAKLKEAGVKRDACMKKLDEWKAAAAEKLDAAKKDAEAALADLKKAVE